MGYCPPPSPSPRPPPPPPAPPQSSTERQPPSWPAVDEQCCIVLHFKGRDFGGFSGGCFERFPVEGEAAALTAWVLGVAGVQAGQVRSRPELLRPWHLGRALPHHPEHPALRKSRNGLRNSARPPCLQQTPANSCKQRPFPCLLLCSYCADRGLVLALKKSRCDDRRPRTRLSG